MKQESVQLLMYKGKGKIGNALIRWWTKSEYSHCEIRIGSLCYSSSLTDGGVRSKVIEVKPENWDIIELNPEIACSVLALFKQTKGKGYSYLDLLLAQIFNTARNRSSKDFCSEWCARALRLPNATTYSPKTLNDLVLYLIEKKVL